VSTNPGQPTVQELMSRVAALEQAQGRLLAELTSGRGAGAAADEQKLSGGTAMAMSAPSGNFASSVPGTPAVTAKGTAGATGVQATSDSGNGIVGQSIDSIGVLGQSTRDIGVNGFSNLGIGVNGFSNQGTGVVGQSTNGKAGEFIGDVSVSGHLSSGGLSSGAGTFASGVFGQNNARGSSGVSGQSTDGVGVFGQSDNGRGVEGESPRGRGVYGQSTDGVGVFGQSSTGPGVHGESSTLAGEFIGNVSVSGNVGIGTTGPSTKLEIDGQTYINHIGDGSVNQLSFNEHGINWGHFYGDSNDRLYFGASNALTTVPSSPIMTWDLGTGSVGIGTTTPSSKLTVQGDVSVTGNLSTAAVTATGDVSVTGNLSSGAGTFTRDVSVTGNLSSGTGTFANNDVFTPAVTATGVIGVLGHGATGVVGQSSIGTGLLGVVGQSSIGTGVVGQTTSIGGYAGEFTGDVFISGHLSKAGGGFTIDHPLDPAHKYLSHSFVESPEMKNLYDGVVTLDAQGQAEVALPSWFAALNADFRYQLTAIGTSAPDLYIAEEITTSGFRIAGGQPGMKVCWQVSAVRQDAWATAHRMVVEQDKPVQEQGSYLHPELYGQSEQQSVVRVRYPHLPRPAVPR
jgi:hypothetical protein